MRKGILLGLFLLLIFCIGSAQAIQLAFNDPAGTVRWYQTEIAMKGNFTVAQVPEPMNIDGTIKFISSEKVLLVNDDGTSTIVTEITDGTIKMTVPGADQPMTMPMPPMKMTYKRAASGKITDMKVEGAQGGVPGVQGMDMGQQLQMFNGTGEGFQFPNHDLTVGFQWNNNMSTEVTPGQKLEMKLANTYQGLKTIDNKTLHQIDGALTMSMPLKMELPVGDQKMTMEEKIDMKMKTFTLFDANAGEINRTWMDGTLKLAMTMTVAGIDPITSNGTMTMTGGMTRIPEPPAKAAAQ